MPPFDLHMKTRAAAWLLQVYITTVGIKARRQAVCSTGLNQNLHQPRPGFAVDFGLQMVL